jgi:vacuolar protein sorting-associated protein 29
LVLVLGDLHIPHRTEDIPEAFKKILVRAHRMQCRRACSSRFERGLTPCALVLCLSQQSKVSQVLCTGNLCMKSTEDYIRSLAYNAHIVRGDLDAGLDLPDSKTIKIGELSIGLIHGHQLVPWNDAAILANHARSIGVDVLIHGHTHAAEVLRSEGSGAAAAKASAAAESGSSGASVSAGASTLLLNPGSITGAFSPFTSQVFPSFCLLAIQGPSVTIYQYEILAGQEVTVTKSEWRKQK